MKRPLIRPMSHADDRLTVTARACLEPTIRHSSFVIRHSLVLRHFAFVLPLLLLCSALTPAIAADPAPRLLDALHLETLRTEVRTNHPGIAAAQARVRAAAAGVRAIRRWEDPMAGVGFMIADREMRADDGDLMFGIEQMLPRRKLQGALVNRARAEQAMLEAEKRTTTLDLETVVGQAVIELALMDEMLTIETNQLAWLESMAANAREMLKDPMANASEPLRMESELALERQKIGTARRQRTRMALHLNTLLGRRVDESWPKLRLPKAPAPTPNLDGELARLHQDNPMLQSLASGAVAAKSEIEAARRERSPVFSVGVESSVYSGGDFRQATLGAKMTLPWFNNSVYRANTERARQQQAAAEKEIAALARRLHGEALAAHTEAETSALQAGTFAEEIIPRAQQAVESTQIAWISSKARILEVLDARRSLLMAQVEERRAVAACQSALEMLRSIIPPGAGPGAGPTPSP